MTSVFNVLRRFPLVELCGWLCVWAAFAFAIAGVSFAFSEKIANHSKASLEREMEDMKTALTIAKISDDQMVGLLNVYRRNFSHHLGQQEFMVVSVLILSSSVVSSFGFSTVLWGRLKTLNRKAVKQTHESNTDA